jgi:hypothetical protein
VVIMKFPSMIARGGGGVVGWWSGRSHHPKWSDHGKMTIMLSTCIYINDHDKTEGLCVTRDFSVVGFTTPPPPQKHHPNHHPSHHPWMIFVEGFTECDVTAGPSDVVPE